MAPTNGPKKGRPASDGDTITLVCIAGSPPALHHSPCLRRWVRPDRTPWELQVSLRRSGRRCHGSTGERLAPVVPIILLVDPTRRENRWHLLRCIPPCDAVICRGCTSTVSQVHEPLSHTSLTAISNCSRNLQLNPSSAPSEQLTAPTIRCQFLFVEELDRVLIDVPQS